MRSIKVLGTEVTGWQVLPADEPDFEEAALRACELILAKDPRIGKVPGARRRCASRWSHGAPGAVERRGSIPCRICRDSMDGLWELGSVARRPFSRMP